MPSGISRRIEQCFLHYIEGDYEGALVNLFPALDKTAKLRYPRLGVGDRFRSFLNDEMDLITAIGTGGAGVMTGLEVDGLTMVQALYKFGRTAIAHEGELDPRLTISHKNLFSFSSQSMVIPHRLVFSMAMVVVIAPENKGESMQRSLEAVIFGKNILINEQWGRPGVIRDLFARNLPH
ncbi:TPA: hypothetical protein ACOJNU_000083 [Pseudomonas putida]